MDEKFEARIFAPMDVFYDERRPSRGEPGEETRQRVEEATLVPARVQVAVCPLGQAEAWPVQAAV